MKTIGEFNRMIGTKLAGAFGSAAALAMMTASIGLGQTLINGAGATFPAPIYTKWFADYRTVNTAVQINYQPIGSGGGIKQITEGTVDFGATDGPMSDEQLKTYETKNGGKILHFPTVLGADVPIFNVSGVSELNFTPEMLSGMYLGKITKWNDAAITKANPKTKLPDAEIVVVHRSDGSGTTYVWADYLSKVNEEWKTKVGKATSVNWPVGLGGKGNEGVAGLVKTTPNSIGYVELIYAQQNKLSTGPVQNSAGVLVKPSLAATTAAAAGAAKAMPPDFRVSITNAPGKDAYPICTFTWLLIPAKAKDASKQAVLKGFVKWAITDGQASAEGLSYAKLPKAVVEMEKKALAQIQ